MSAVTSTDRTVQVEDRVRPWEPGPAPSISPVGRLRLAALAPGDHEVRTEVRGFSAWEGAPSMVEPVGAAFLAGFRAGLGAGSVLAAGAWLQHLPAQGRGFAMEGLGMAAGVRDGLTRSKPHVPAVLARYGETHGYMIHVGVGWAMARLPTWRWPSLRRLSPLLAPLALDGYGFHEVFFNTAKVLRDKAIDFPLDRGWPGNEADGGQELMQGVGRGLWFVCGGSPALVADRIGDFHSGWHGSMWSGIGLASSYAGGADAQTLHTLIDLAGEHRPWMLQGSAFAIEARARADAVVPHTLLAAQALHELSVEEISEVTRRCRPAATEIDNDDWTTYEQWRARIAEELS